MVGSKKNKNEKKDYSKIGFYGRPITDLSRDELLAALAELSDMYTEKKEKTKNAKKF